MIFKINRIVRAIEADVGLDAIGARARALLRLIGEENAAGTAPRTGDLVASSGGLGTPPTIYASLEELERGGWIERRWDEKDARARRLYLTPQARKVFARMSRQVERAL